MYKNKRNLIINTYLKKLNKVLIKYVSFKNNQYLFKLQNNYKCFIIF